MLPDGEDDATVGDQTEGTGIVDLTDEVIGLAADICGDGDVDRGGFWLADGEKSFAYLGR